MFFIVVAAVLATGCEKDTDCDAARVCQAGSCLSPLDKPLTPPPLVSEPPPASPNESDASRVYRLNGQFCRDTIDANGEAHRECVAESARKAPTPRSPAQAPALPPTPLVGTLNLVAHGGLCAAALTNVYGTCGIVGFSVGAMLMFGRFGFGALLLGDFSPFPKGVMHSWTAGPAVRVGATHHVSLGYMPSVTVVPTSARSLSVTVMSAVVVEVALQFGHFTIAVHPALRFGPPGVLFTLTGGVGVAF